MLGLIFGETNFPVEILKKIKKKNLKYLIIDLTKKKILKRTKILTRFQLVNLEKSSKYLKTINAKKFYLLVK